jgi:hypothetical protein
LASGTVTSFPLTNALKSMGLRRQA